MARDGVLVIGSINADVTAFADRLPEPGQTVRGRDVSVALGGKGANQALAAARYGEHAQLLGCVGTDTFADLTLDELARAKVDTTNVRRVAGRTGVAHIRVDARGENDIVIAPLANSALTRQDVDTVLAKVTERVSVVLLQLEIAAAIAGYAVTAAHRAGLAVVLDPAPAVSLPSDAWRGVDIVTPNESEAAELTGVGVLGPQTAERAATWFLDRGVDTVVVTLGERGAVLVDDRGSTVFEPFPVAPVDSTAAGDAFTGTLGAAVARGDSLPAAVSTAMAAGALAVTKPGASAALPERHETLALLRHQRGSPTTT
jgi:ribokinase